MTYLSSPVFPSVQEPSTPYSPFSRQNVIYEVSLQTAADSTWLQNLSNAHRLVQVLLQGELLEDYALLDFLIWPEGFFTRVSLKKTPSLAEFLKSLKEKSVPYEGRVADFWDAEPRWIRLVLPEKLGESTRFFIETAESVRRHTPASFPHLFFLYRNPRWFR